MKVKKVYLNKFNIKCQFIYSFYKPYFKYDYEEDNINWPEYLENFKQKSENNRRFCFWGGSRIKMVHVLLKRRLILVKKAVKNLDKIMKHKGN